MKRATVGTYRGSINTNGIQSSLVTLYINYPRIEVNMTFRNLRHFKNSRDTLKTLKSSGSTSWWDFVKLDIKDI